MKHYTAILHTIMVFLLAACTMEWEDKPRIHNAVSYKGLINARSLTEGQRTIKGRLSLPTPTKGRYRKVTIVATTGRPLEAYWPDWDDSIELLDLSTTYNIDLLTTIYTDPDYVFNEVLKVSANGRVLIDASVCHVHRFPMQRQIEHVTSMCAYPPSFLANQVNRFPNDGNAYLACDAGIRHPKWRCPECNRMYHLWTKRYGVDEGL